MICFTLKHYRAHQLLNGIENGCVVQPPPKLPRDAKMFWRVADLPDCDGGVIAWHKERVAGFCRYNLNFSASGLRTATLLVMAGTWVAPSYRRRGLAVHMWGRVFKSLHSGTEVQVITVSTKGDMLVEKLCELHQRLRFNSEQGCRYPQLEADRGILTNTGSFLMERIEVPIKRSWVTICPCGAAWRFYADDVEVTLGKTFTDYSTMEIVCPACNLVLDVTWLITPYSAKHALELAQLNKQHGRRTT